MDRLRFYYDGKLKKSLEVTNGEWSLDRIESDWRKSGENPLVLPGEFDPNNAHTIERLDVYHLNVVTTGNHKLKWIVVPTNTPTE